MRKSNQYAAITLIWGALAATTSYAFPYDSVIRLRAYEGNVSFSPVGTDSWVEALINRPLINGDSLWNDAATQVSLQTAHLQACMGERSLIKVLNVNEMLVQLQLQQGSLELHVARNNTNQEYEISTPNLSALIYQPGVYRIDVDTRNQTTTVSVVEGELAVYGESISYYMIKDDSLAFAGQRLDSFKSAPLKLHDHLNEWCLTQLPINEDGASGKYVSEEVIGYQDLDREGDWVNTRSYGWAWTPKDLDSTWAPYRDGRWNWVEPWGWTWIPAEPWGFAIYHYGRWFHEGEKWYWIPGPKAEKAVYAPAMVAFLLIDLGKNIGWYPLAPDETYWPSYYISKDYFKQVNLSNAHIDGQGLERAFENPAETVKHRYQLDEYAVSFMSAQDFTNAVMNPTGTLQYNQASIDKAIGSPVAETAPHLMSLQGTTRKGKTPPRSVLANKTLLLSGVPESGVAFKSRESLLAKDPGRTLDPETMKALMAKQKPKSGWIIIKPPKPEENIGTKVQDARAQARARQAAEQQLELERQRMARERARVERMQREAERERQEAREERRWIQEQRRRDEMRRQMREDQRFRDERRHREERRYRDDQNYREDQRQRQRRDQQSQEQQRQDQQRRDAQQREAQQRDNDAKAKEQARLKEEADKKQQEQNRLREEEQKRLQDQAIQKQNEEAQKATEAQKAAAEEQQRRAQEEAQKAAAEEQQRRAQEEAQRRQAEEQQRQAQEAAQRQAEEQQRQAQEAAQRQAEEQQRQAQEAAQRQAEEQQRQAQEAAQRQAEEQQRQAQEAAQRQAEEQQRQAEEQQRRDQEQQNQQNPPPP